MAGASRLQLWIRYLERVCRVVLALYDLFLGRMHVINILLVLINLLTNVEDLPQEELALWRGWGGWMEWMGRV